MDLIAVVWNLFTALSTGLILVFVIRAAKRATDAEDRLKGMRARLVETERQIASLAQTHRRFAGAFYHERRGKERASASPYVDDVDLENQARLDYQAENPWRGIDPELAAELALQGNTPKPNGSP